MERGTTRSVGATLGFIIVPVVIGIPMVAYLWETLNQLLTGTVSGRRVAISVPVLVLFILLLRWLARRVVAFDHVIEAPADRSA